MRLDEVFAETVSEITRFTKPSYMTLFQNAEKLVMATPCSEDVYEKYTLNEIFRTSESLDLS